MALRLKWDNLGKGLEAIAAAKQRSDIRNIQETSPVGLDATYTTDAYGSLSPEQYRMLQEQDAAFTPLVGQRTGGYQMFGQNYDAMPSQDAIRSARTQQIADLYSRYGDPEKAQTLLDADQLRQYRSLAMDRTRQMTPLEIEAAQQGIRGRNQEYDFNALTNPDRARAIKLGADTAQQTYDFNSEANAPRLEALQLSNRATRQQIGQSATTFANTQEDRKITKGREAFTNGLLDAATQIQQGADPVPVLKSLQALYDKHPDGRHLIVGTDATGMPQITFVDQTTGKVVRGPANAQTVSMLIKQGLDYATTGRYDAAILAQRTLDAGMGKEERAARNKVIEGMAKGEVEPDVGEQTLKYIQDMYHPTSPNMTQEQAKQAVLGRIAGAKSRNEYNAMRSEAISRGLVTPQDIPTYGSSSGTTKKGSGFSSQNFEDILTERKRQAGASAAAGNTSRIMQDRAYEAMQAVNNVGSLRPGELEMIRQVLLEDYTSGNAPPTTEAALRQIDAVLQGRARRAMQVR